MLLSFSHPAYREQRRSLSCHKTGALEHDLLILPVFEETGPRERFGVERGDRLRSREQVPPKEERIDAMPMRERETPEKE